MFGVGKWIEFYNRKRSHSDAGGKAAWRRRPENLHRPASTFARQNAIARWQTSLIDRGMFFK